MLATIDDKPASTGALWWPAMNFGQFRSNGSVGNYVLELPRAALVERLTDAYAQCVSELQEDDRRITAQEPSALRNTGYAPLNVILDNAAARLELIQTYLYQGVLEAFIPPATSAGARFMINSVDEVAAQPGWVILRGRGYHAAPGFDRSSIGISVYGQDQSQ